MSEASHDTNNGFKSEKKITTVCANKETLEKKKETLKQNLVKFQFFSRSHFQNFTYRLRNCKKQSDVQEDLGSNQRNEERLGERNQRGQ